MTTFNDHDVRSFFRLMQLGNPEAVIELRAPEFRENPARAKSTFSGYFDNEDEFVKAAARATRHSGCVYATINVCNPQLLCRAANRAQPYAPKTTSDSEILRRRYLPIDLDPERPSGTSASDEQHDAALKRGETVVDYIIQKGWPEPIVVDSGNGCHLLMPFDFPHDEPTKALVGNILKALDSTFSDQVIKVDVSVGNAAQPMRLPGTQNRKGDHLPKYPHRLCRILSIPESLQNIAETTLKQKEVL